MINPASDTRSQQSQTRFLLIALIVAIAILIARSWYLDSPDIVMDDSYISFRYSINVVNGLGLVYNPNEYVEGYTNFLWTMLLAGCAFLGLDIVVCSKIVALWAAIGTLVVLYRFSLDLFAKRQGILVITALPLILFAVMPAQARYVVSGMETLLFVFLVTWSIYLCYRRHWLAAGMMFCLAAMTRPEGMIYFAIAFGYNLLFLRADLRQPQQLRTYIWHFLGSFVLFYGIYLLWRYSYYGYFLPNTFYAKASGFNFVRLIRGVYYLNEVIQLWNILPLLIISLFALPSARSHPIWLLFAGLSVITVVYFIYVGGDFVVWFGPRFFMPILPFLLLLVAEGLFRIVSLLKALPVARSFAWLGSLLLVSIGLWFSWPARFDQLHDFRAQMRSWRELGNWMGANLPAQTKIATDAAGLIPFYSNFYAIDMFGLTDEYIAHLEMPNPGTEIVAHEKFDPGYILRRQPDCIVSTWMDAEGRAISAGLDTLTNEFQAAYALVAVAKVRYGPPDDGRWVIATSTYSTDLYNNGYQTGLFCSKRQ